MSHTFHKERQELKRSRKSPKGKKPTNDKPFSTKHIKYVEK